MTTTQRIIKYLALALAFAMLAGMVTLVFGFVGFVSGIYRKPSKDIGEMCVEEYSGDIKNLKINVHDVNVEIKKSDTFTVGTNNKKISVKSDGDTLTVKEPSSFRFIFDTSLSGDLIITVPKDFDFDDVVIENGAGVIKIEGLKCKKLDLDFGAGRADVENVISSDSTNVDGGAGMIDFVNVSFANLDFDMGVGNVYFKGEISGKSEIDFGVGESSICLKGEPDDYMIKVDKGIGKATIDDNNVTDGKSYGDGDRVIYMDGGVGNIDISFYKD